MSEPCVSPLQTDLQMADDHLFEPFHGGASGGLVEGCPWLPPDLRRQTQGVARGGLHLKPDDPLKVTPGPRVHLEYREYEKLVSSYSAGW